MTILDRIKHFINGIVEYKFKTTDIAFHPVDDTLEERKHRDVNYMEKIEAMGINNTTNIQGTTKGSGKKHILLMDDIEETSLITNIVFKDIERKCGKNVYNDYVIHYAFGPDAARKAVSIINNNRIDIALLDITLGEMVILPDGSKVEVDGVDIGLYIMSKNKDSKVMFLSAHSLNLKNPLMKYYYNKFIKNAKLNIEDHFINKGENDKLSIIMDLLYGEVDE